MCLTFAGDAHWKPSSRPLSSASNGNDDHAIIANCELVMVVGSGRSCSARNSPPLSTLGGGLIFAGVLLHSS